MLFNYNYSEWPQKSISSFAAFGFGQRQRSCPVTRIIIIDEWRDDMLKKALLIIPMILFFRVAFSHELPDVDDQIKELSATEYGRQFLVTHSVANMKKVILFLQRPVEYFGSIKPVNDFCEYVFIYRRYINESKKLPSDFYDQFLRNNFASINKKNVPILTFLLLGCQKSALFGEVLADAYTVLFESNPEIFVEDLKKREDWKRVIDALASGSWPALQAGLNKLGDSEFEKAIKAYVSSRRSRGHVSECSQLRSHRNSRQLAA